MRVLSRRTLNRATLERQLLLRRWELPALEAIDRLVGLNAQDSDLPYLGLWARLEGFDRRELTQLIYDRRAVRSTMMRSTVHLVSVADFVAFRGVLQPVLERTQRGHFGRRTAGVHPSELVAASRALLAQRTLTRSELQQGLGERWPGHDSAALAWSVQYLEPLVHTPPIGTWGTHGATSFALAEDWLGRRVSADRAPVDIVRRYLAAFGPAGVMDAQAWSGLTGLREVIERLRPELRVARDEAGRELFDLADAPTPDPDTPAPPRFLPAVDNLLVAHTDRTRIMSEEVRQRVCVDAGVGPSVLVDGRVVGMWRLVRDHETATLLVEQLDRLSKEDRVALSEEGIGLLAFASADATSRDIRFESS